MVANLARQALYLQVREDLSRRIAEGVWKPGACLPNEGDLSREYGVSAGTMRKALDMLEADKLVERRQGRGTFVLDQTNDELSHRFDKLVDAGGKRITHNSSVILCQKVEAATAAERDHLRIQDGTPVLRTRCVRHHQGRPFSYEETSLAIARLPGFPHNGQIGDYLIVPFALGYGTLVVGAVEKITIVEAPTGVPQLLDVEPKRPLLRLDRVAFTSDKQPLEWRVALCEPGETRYLAEMR